MNQTRTVLREKIVNTIYSCIIQEGAHIDYDPAQIFLGVFGVEQFSDIDIFAQDVYVQAMKNKDEIIALVQPKLKNWLFSRLNCAAQAILIEAVAEGKYTSYTTKPIVINCAVELAKKYLDSQDYKYINAVLDKVL